MLPNTIEVRKFLYSMYLTGTGKRPHIFFLNCYVTGKRKRGEGTKERPDTNQHAAVINKTSAS